MSQFAGNHPVVTSDTPNVNYQAVAGGPGRDVSVDGHGTVVPGFLDEWSQNAAVAALLRSFGWNGSAFGDKAKEAFEYLRQHSASAGRQSMLRDLWDAAGREGLRNFTVVGTPAPEPSSTVDPEHQHSPGFKGWKREVIYALETCNTEFAKGIDAALAAGRVSQAERDSFIKQRLALNVALGDVAISLPDDINPGEPVPNPTFKGQAECDAIYDYCNQLRELMARKDLGFFKSQENRHLVNALRNMSGVALSLGLKGKKLSYLLFGQPYQTRDSEYVTGFYSWESQDPVAKKIGDELGAAVGSQGLNVGSGR